MTVNYRLITVEKWRITLPETNPKLVMQYKVITPEITHTHATLSEFKCVCMYVKQNRPSISEKIKNYKGGMNTGGAGGNEGKSCLIIF